MTAFEGTIAARARLARSRAGSRLGWARPRPELAGLVALAAVLDLWALGQNGWANTYYSAAVRSMSTSWHNFLYVSFDPSGTMTVDKPPLALWVQALSVRLFGYHPLSMLVPQALMGVASVALVYDLTRRRFGRGAGFVAGLALATTPIAVAVSRHNNPDALLVLCLAAALWFVVRGLEDGRTRWLVLAGVSVGLGFETKMAAALLVVPALAAAWLWIAPRGRVAALRQLLAGGAALVAVGGAWPLLVTLTPASSRPWISGTTDNSIWSLIFGYNGLGRLDGQAGGPQIAGGGAGGGGFFGGGAGPLRLLNSSLGGQAGWLLGFAIVAGLAILLVSRLRRTDARSGWLLATGGAFVTIAVAFSAAKGIFHPYYTSELAPFTAALVGGGAAQLLAPGRRMWLLAPLAVAAGVAVELAVLHSYPGELSWLAPVLIALGALAALALLLRRSGRPRIVALAVALGVLLIAPATWAVDTLGHATSGTFPAGGPASATLDGGPGRFGGGRGLFGGPPGGLGGGSGPRTFGLGGGARFGSAAGTLPPGGPPPGALVGGGAARGGSGGGAGFGGENSSLTSALRYVQQHGGGTIAVASQSGAAQAIIASGAKVAGIGGFSGRESSVTPQWLAGEVRSGRIRWVLTGGTGFGGARDGRAGSTVAFAAVAQTCKRTTYSGAATSGGGAFGSTTNTVLYDCAGRADALSNAHVQQTSSTGA